MASLIEDSGQVMSAVVDLIAAPALVYFWVANTALLALTGLAIWEFLRDDRRKGYAGSEEIVSSQLAQGVSVIVPALNQEAVIVRSVHSMLALRYPRHEVIVVDHGSADATFERLRRSFDLVPVVTEIPTDLPTLGRVIDVHVPHEGHTPLVVVRTENHGRSDAINVGVNAAKELLVGIVDADLFVDSNALIDVSKPFADDPTRVVASGGVLRVGNGSRFVDGRLVDARPAKAWIVRIQIVEYLRAFLLGRSGWSRFRGVMLIPGAVAMFRRDILVEVGGYDPDRVGADFELVIRLHRHMIKQGREYSVHLVAGQVSWKEVPATCRGLRAQRMRWHRELAGSLWMHRGMLFRPEYGLFGSVVLPYYWVFELVSPMLELMALLLVGIGFALGLLSGSYLLLFLVVVYGYGTVVTLVTLTVEEVTFHKYTRWRDLAVIVLASVLENLGYRQLTAWWRLEGLVAR